MRGLVLVLALVSCGPSGGGEKPGGVPGIDGPPTDTLPSFRGRVPKNLVFISIDTFRRDHMRRYGNGQNLVPFLDDLADNGFALDNHTQCSNWTFASTTCTLLGRYNIDNGLIPKMSKTYREPLPEGTSFLATWLRDAGFHTILISPNAWLGPKWGNAQGYTDFAIGGSPASRVYGEGSSLLERALDRGADRWFLHIHLLEPHAAYEPPASYLAKVMDLPPLGVDLTDRDEHYALRDAYPDLEPDEQDLLEQHLRLRYQAELTYLDDMIEGVMEDLGARGWLDDTLVVFWTDHGEQFWEHGRHTHAYDLYREENDAVAFFWASNIVPGTWDGPTVSIDLVPTILQLFDIPIPEEVTGIPVGEALDDRSRFAFAIARHGPVQSVRREHLKLHFDWDGQVGLFDLAEDPREQHNLYDPVDPVVEGLWAELVPMVEKAEVLAPEHSVSWPEGAPR